MKFSKALRKLRILVGGTNFLLNDLKKRGANIGKNIKIHGPSSVVLDDTRPYLLEIGDYTNITHGATILTHDYSKCVLREVYGQWIGEGAKTVIGKNCFIGVNSTILMGARIGDNTIVGAGSVVHGVIPSNVVVAGNPAKVVCTLEEYYNKRKERTVEEARNCAKIFYQRFGRKPSESDMAYFRFLFQPVEARRSKESNPLPPVWDGFEAFLQSIDFEAE